MSVGQLSVGVVLSLIDRFSPGMHQVESRLSSMSTGLAKIGTVATGAGMALGAVGDRVLDPLKKVAGAAMAFESAMADVNKVVDFDAPDGLATMSAQLDRMTHTIPLAATGLASIAAEGGQLGIAAPDLTGYVEVVAKMATAFDMLPQRAGESMAKLANVYDLPIARIGSLGDAINHLSNNSAAKASEIVNVLARVGGVAKGFGLTAVQASALGSAFIALGKTPEVAATGINALLLKLQTATRQNKEFKDGIVALGLTQEGVESAIARDAQGTLSDFLSRLAAVKSEARAGIMVDLFGLEYSDDMSALVGGLDQYHKALSLVGDESAYAGSMQAEFAARAATTENGMILLSNRMASVGRTLGAVMLPPLSEAADRIGLVVTRVGDWLQAHPRFTGGLVMGAAGLGVFAAALSPVLMGVGALAIGGAAALRGLTMLGPAAMAAGRGLQAGLMGAVGAVRALSLALFANPIGLAVLGIAGAALVIRKYWEPLSGFFSGLWSGLSDGLAPVGAAIGSALAPLAEMTQRWLAPLSGLLAPVGAWFTGAFAPVAGALAAPITALQNLWTWVTNILAPVQGVGGAAESMGHRWGMAIAGMIGKAAELVGAFAGLAGRFAQIGAEIVQGLINGFVARWGALKAKVSELAGGMVGAVQGVLKMHSPSRVFAEIGRYAVQGIEVGLGEREPALLGRMRETAARFAAVPLLAGALGAAAMPAQPPMASAALPAVSGANPALRIDDPASAARDARRAAWLGDARARTAPQVPQFGPLSLLAPQMPQLGPLAAPQMPQLPQFGPLLAPQMPQLGPLAAPQMPQLPQFGPLLAPQMPQLGPLAAPQMPQLPQFGPLSLPQLPQFGPLLAPQMPQLGPLAAPQMPQLGPLAAPQMPQLPQFGPLSLPQLPQFGPLLAPQMPQLGPLAAPQMPQLPQFGPLSLLAPQMPQLGPLAAPQMPQLPQFGPLSLLLPQMPQLGPLAAPQMPQLPQFGPLSLLLPQMPQLGPLAAPQMPQLPQFGPLSRSSAGAATDRRPASDGGAADRGRAGAAAASGGGGGITVNIGPITVNGDADGAEVAQRIRREVELALRQHRERDELARRGRMFD